jgi:hypothetical protein
MVRRQADQAGTREGDSGGAVMEPLATDPKALPLPVISDDRARHGRSIHPEYRQVCGRFLSIRFALSRHKTCPADTDPWPTGQSNG